MKNEGSDNKIIAVRPDTDIEAAPRPRGLRNEDVLGMRKAIIRLNELQSSKVATPTSEAEVQGLQNFLASALTANADEFIATWLVCTNEYMTLVRAWTAFSARCSSIQNAALPAEKKP